MRSASILLERGGDAENVAPRFRKLLSFAEAESRPRILRLQVSIRQPGVSSELGEQLARAAGTGGVAWSREGGSAQNAWLGGALMRLTCGSSPGVYRTLYADLRAGEYALPACEQVELSAAYWRPTLAPDELGLSPLELQGEVADGELVDPSPLLLTCWRIKPWTGADTGDAYARCPVPPGAWGFDVLSSLSRVHAICGGEYVMRERGGAWTPPTTPVILAGPDTRVVSLWTDVPAGEQTGTGWLAGVVFYLR